MSLCSRLAIAAAAGVLAASAATPAVAAGSWATDPGNGSHTLGDADGYGDDDTNDDPGRTDGDTGGNGGNGGNGTGSYGDDDSDDDSYGNDADIGTGSGVGTGTTGGTGTSLDAAGTTTAPQTPGAGATGGDGRQQGSHHSGYYKGVVTASTLALRSAPNRGSQIIRYAHRGDIVKIYCKTGGETIDGNPLWYLLPDGTWAWGAARYIDNIGPAPRWC